MKVKLAGHRIRHIREQLGMTTPQFATIMAVHPGTVHRWEASGDGQVPIDGVAAGILAVLDQKVSQGSRQPSDFKPQEVGEQVVQALLVGGALFALGLLIAELVGKGKRG